MRVPVRPVHGAGMGAAGLGRPGRAYSLGGRHTVRAGLEAARDAWAGDFPTGDPLFTLVRSICRDLSAAGTLDGRGDGGQMSCIPLVGFSEV